MKQRFLSRKRRFSPSLEYLEDRNLLSGNVTALLNPANGALAIQGDLANGNNAIHLTEYQNAGVNYLRVQGDLVITPPAPPDFTSVNGVSYTDFVLSSVSSITINMTNGNDKVNIGTNGTNAIPVGATLLPGLQIPGNLSITLGTGKDTVSITGSTTPVPGTLTNTTANLISITTGANAAGDGNTTVTLTTVTAGIVSVRTGFGSDTITATSEIVGSMTLNGGGGGNDTISVTNSPGTTSPVRPGVGLLTIQANGGGTENITVGGGATGTTLGNVTIQAVGAGNATVNLGAPAPAAQTTEKVVSIITGNGKNAINVVNNSMTSAAITNGTGDASSITFNNNVVTGAAGLSLTTNNSALQKNNTIKVDNNTFSNGNVTVLAGDGQVYVTAGNPGTALAFSSFEATGDTGVNAASITLGKNWRNVTVGSDLAANEFFDKSLALTVGDNADTVKVFAATSNNETILISTGAGMYVRPTTTTTVIPDATVTVNGSVGGNLDFRVGANADNVQQNATVTGNENVVIGNALTAAQAPGLAATAVTIKRPTGPTSTSTIQIGDNWSSITVSGVMDGSETITLGNNDSITIKDSLTGNETIHLGTSTGDSVTIVASIAGTTTIDGTASNATVLIGPPSPNPGTPTDVADINMGPIAVTLGTGANVTLQNLTTTDGITVTVGDNAVSVFVWYVTMTGDLNINSGNSIAPTGATFFWIQNTTVGGNMNLNALGGSNTVYMVSLAVDSGLMSMSLRSAGGINGDNNVFAMAVTTLFGLIDGGGSPTWGAGASANYYDLGGNLGLFTQDFDGYY